MVSQNGIVQIYMYLKDYSLKMRSVSNSLSFIVAAIICVPYIKILVIIDDILCATTYMGSAKLEQASVQR